MKNPLIFLIPLLLCCLIAPAMAGNYTTLVGVGSYTTYTVGFDDVSHLYFNSYESDESAIGTINLFSVDPGTYDLTLTQANGAIHTGQIIYDWSGVLGVGWGNWTLTLDGNSYNWEGASLSTGKTYVQGYAQNVDTEERGIILYEVWAGSTFDVYQHSVFSPVSDIVDYPLTIVEISSPTGSKLSASVEYGDYSDISSSISSTPTGLLGWLSVLYDFLATAFYIIYELIYIFKWIFVDHLLAIIVFCESVALALSAASSKSFWDFLEEFYSYNKSFYDLIIRILMDILDMLHKIIDMLKLT